MFGHEAGVALFYYTCFQALIIMNLLTRNDPAKVSWLTILLYQNRMVLTIYMISLKTVKTTFYSPFRWVFGKQGKMVVSPVQSFRILINEVGILKSS
jgi:hypothetical protein